MKYLLLTAILAFAVSALIAQQNAFWQEVNRPYGLLGETIYPTQDQKVYASNDANPAFVYRSEDYGENWQKLDITLPDPGNAGKEHLFISPAGVFYKQVDYVNGSGGLFARSLYKSDDEGQNWVLQNNQMNLFDLEIVATPSGALIAADGNNQKISRSTDGGQTWQTVYQGAVITAKTGLQYTGNGKLLLTSDSPTGFYLSEDDGQNWAAVNMPTPALYSKGFLAASGALFAADVNYFTGLYRSDDGGASWVNIPFNLGQHVYYSYMINLENGNLLFSTDENIFSSSDDGHTWNQIPEDAEQARSYALGNALPNGDILAMVKDGLYRSSDNGFHWSFSSYGLQRSGIVNLKAFSKAHQLALTGTGLWETMDSGETWDRILADTAENDVVYSDISNFAVSNAQKYALRMGQQIWRTTNGGQSFNNITPPGSSPVFPGPGIFSTTDAILFCNAGSGVMRLAPGNGTWAMLFPDTEIRDFAEHPSGDLYCIKAIDLFSPAPAELWKSANAGNTWQKLNTLNLGSFEIVDLEIDNLGTIYVRARQNTSMKLAVSTDGGLSWDYRIIPETYINFSQMGSNTRHLFVSGVTLPSSLISSVDQGISWYRLPPVGDYTNLTNNFALSDDGYLYVITLWGTVLRTAKSTTEGAFIQGQVFKDNDNDCSTIDTQEPLPNVKIQLDGLNTLYSISNEDGRYAFFVDTGSYTLKAIPPYELWWAFCDTVQTVQVDNLNGGVDTVNFYALPISNCPLMAVNVGMPRLRRCFDNTIYVSYCNVGTEPADNPWVDVTLDPYLDFVQSGQAYQIIAADTIRFFVDDLASGDCGQFQLTVHVNCDSTVLGQTHCVSAHGFPDTLCAPVPNWSGATINASVECQDTTVRLQLKNNGAVPSKALDYIIIEDDVVLFSGQKSYDAGESYSLEYPANGHTWRIESEQEPGHPFSSLALAFTEGCGGFNSTGFINQFTVNGDQPSWHRVCLENAGSYDPNDKQGFPLGFGFQNRVYHNQPINYLIRFQNTGTDTAFNIVVRDTLSSFLDPTTLRPGASSHPYTWELSGEGAVHFNFYNIMLPDSNVNEANSHGFVQFTIYPRSDAAHGSVIENKAHIYFDFNAPVETNTTRHTIDRRHLSGGVYPVRRGGREPGISIWPNPAQDYLQIRAPQQTPGVYRIKVFDNLGRLVAQNNTPGIEMSCNLSGWPAGVYWVELFDEQSRLVGRKQILKSM